MPDIQLIHGDCIVKLSKLPENSVDSVVCDPPYDLTSGGSTGFMGKAWDGSGVAFRVETWREVMRVLKPGGFLLAFGGTRTHHRLMCAIEDAGFEIRDTLSWMYGSGFPKSRDISKAIDSEAGINREVIGSKITGNAKQRANKTGEFGSWANQNTSGQQIVDVTLPASDAAKEWSGWGTSLKPAWEPIILARKPVSESTVANNVLKYGTGALNIDATRIAGSWERSTTHKEDIRGGNFHADNGNKQYEVPPQVSPEGGRWPANVTLSHTSECVQVGQRKIKGYVINRFDDGAKPFGDGAGHPYTSESFGDEDGNETIDVWKCVEDCAVRLLDEQSGTLTSGTGAVKRESAAGYQPNAFSTESRPVGTPMVEYGDTGGASRYFYTSKSSVWEREAGLESLEVTERLTPMAGRGQPGLKCVKCGHWKNSGSPCTCDEPYFEQSTFEHPDNRNSHPTVKPLDLMRWLIKLVTRPGGTVLDCFMGSGSTGCAAVIEGMNFIGIEAEAEYVAIAEKRIAYWKSHPAPYVISPVLERQLKPGQIVSVKPVRAKPVDPKQAGLF